MDYSSLDFGYEIIRQLLKVGCCFIVTIVLLYVRKELKDVVDAKIRAGEPTETNSLTALLVIIGIVNIYAIFVLRDIVYTVQRLWS